MLESKIEVSHISDDHVKCPRCWQYTIVGRHNFDGLCDRCCDVILEHYPEHWSAEGIRESRAEQRKRWR